MEGWKGLVTSLGNSSDFVSFLIAFLEVNSLDHVVDGPCLFDEVDNYLYVEISPLVLDNGLNFSYLFP
jgi:hypothetical protein